MAEPSKVAELVERWESKLPKKRQRPDGVETMFSYVMRWKAAERLQAEEDARTDEGMAARKARLEADAQAEFQRLSREREGEFWAEMPAALSRMGLDAREIRALGDLQERPGVLQARAWRKASDKIFLILGGDPQHGKTIAAASVMAEEAREQLACSTFSAPVWNTGRARLVQAVAVSRLSLWDKEDRRALEHWMRVPLLVLDDLGAEAKTDQVSQSIHELIDRRFRDELRTVITTNLSSKDLASRYGDRIFERLVRNGQWVRVEESQAAGAPH